jgi:hypothetical protein
MSLRSGEEYKAVKSGLFTAFFAAFFAAFFSPATLAFSAFSGLGFPSLSHFIPNAFKNAASARPVSLSPEMFPLLSALI